MEARPPGRFQQVQTQGGLKEWERMPLGATGGETDAAGETNQVKCKMPLLQFSGPICVVSDGLSPARGWGLGEREVQNAGGMGIRTGALLRTPHHRLQVPAPGL